MHLRARGHDSPHHRERESLHHVTGCDAFAYPIAFAAAFSPSYHRRPKGSASEIRSKPRWSLRGLTRTALLRLIELSDRVLLCIDGLPAAAPIKENVREHSLMDRVFRPYW